MNMKYKTEYEYVRSTEYRVCLTPHVLHAAKVAQVAQVDRRLLLSCRSDRLLLRTAYKKTTVSTCIGLIKHRVRSTLYSVLSISAPYSSQARHYWYYCIMNYY